MLAPPLTTVLYFTPMALGGVAISTISSTILHFIPAMWLLIISGVAWILCPVFLAVAVSGHAHYFPLMFLAMICGTVGADLTFLIFMVFCTDVQPVKYQGLSGALVSVVVNVSIAFALSLGDIVQSAATRTSDHADGDGGDEETDIGGFKAVFWFAAGLSVAGFLVVVAFIRTPSIGSEKRVGPDEEFALVERKEHVVTDPGIQIVLTKASVAAQGGQGIRGRKNSVLKLFGIGE